MAGKQLRFGAEARAALMAGIDAVADAVGVTLGPKGRYVIVDRSRDPRSTGAGEILVTDDGVTVAREIELEPGFENQGARLIRAVAAVTDDVAGDGTTTATVLAQAMVREGLRRVAAGANPVAMRRGIERAVLQAVEHVAERQAIGIADSSQLARVAALAAGEEAIGAVVAEAFEAVGADGVVTVRRAETGAAAVALELTEGLSFAQGYVSPHMITDRERGEAVLEDADILIANQEVSDAEQLIPMLEHVAAQGRPLLVIADKLSGSALGLLVRNVLEGGVRCVGVKARHVGEHRRRHLEEVALFTGGESIPDKLDLTQPSGMTIEAAFPAQLGRAERVVVTRNSTLIVGGAGDPEAVAARIGHLRREIDETDDVGERSRLEERLAELAGVTAVIRVGAATETEAAERRLRTQDAVRAARAALREGIVPGGGVALLEAGEAIDAGGLTPDEAAGAETVRRALSEPVRRIAENAGLDGSVATRVTRDLPSGDGLDVIGGEYVDMIDAGVLDPALVVRVALQSAASIAKVVLATEAVVIDRGRPPAGPDEEGHVPAKRLRYGAAARRSLQGGVEAVTRAVAVTLGPSGRNVVFPARLRDADGGGIVITNDGVTVAGVVDVRDPFEALGARLVREVAGATNDDAGDGTTTATLLAGAIVAVGQRNVVAGAEPLALRRGIERAGEQAVAHLRDVQSADVAGRDELARVAAVACGDPAMGAMVADACERVGRDGIVSLEAGHTRDLQLDVTLGMRWDKGYLSRDMATDPARGEAVLEHPHVLCVDQRIGSGDELLPVLELAAESGRPLLLVVLGMDEHARTTLLRNQARGHVTAVAVTAPDFLERRRRNLEDIAVLTGGEAITEELGLRLEHVRRAQLGSARRVVVTRETTTIVDGAGDRVAIEARIDGLRRELDRDDQLPFFRERLRERLARLAAGVAVVRVGAHTEAEGRERMLRAEDAVRAAQAALREGVVPGGGVALLRARDAIDASGLEPDEATGAGIVRRALEEPLRGIARNAGLEPSVVVERVRTMGPRDGLDAAAGQYRDLVEAGIVDATLVVRSALENAISVAKTLLLAECVAARATPDGLLLPRPAKAP
jgi:chaperonin GroEL